MNKKIFLLIPLLFSVLLLFGCTQQPVQPSGDSGLNSDSKSLEDSISSSDSELSNGLNEIPGIDINPSDFQAVGLSGLETDEALLAEDQALNDSLSTALSDFTEIDFLNAINPADLQ